MNGLTCRKRSRSISSTMLEGVRRGQNEAWNRLVEVWNPIIYRWCRKRGLQADDAEDVTQEVLLQVCQKVREFKHESFTGWISTITKHKVDDRFRNAAQRPRAIGGSGEIITNRPDSDINSSGDDSDGSLADDSDSRSLIVRQVLQVIQGDFDGRTFKAFWRRTVDGVPSAGVAEELGMTDDAVRQAKRRVLKRLREELEAMGICVTCPSCS
jgi:RNA polymerase sigma-70 factor, ECF subfamily